MGQFSIFNLRSPISTLNFLVITAHWDETEPRMSESAQFTSAMDHSVSGLKKLIKNHLKFSLARDTQTASRRDWWLATSKAAQSLIIERMIATQAAHHRVNAKRVYYFSLEFLMGRLFSNSLYSAGIFDDMEHGLAGDGPRYRNAAQGGVRHGAGQWRPRPPGRVFPRFAGHARSAGDRLRHPLPVRPLQAGVPQRPPGRIARRLADLRHAVGNRAPGAFHRGADLRPGGKRLRRPRKLCAALDRDEENRRRALRYPHPGLRHQHREFPAPVGIARARRNSISRPSIAAATARPCGKRTPAKPSRRFSIRTTRPKAARNCASCSSTSSSPVRCATSSAASARTTRRGRISRKRSPSSSTTRIPPSPSSNCCGSFTTSTAWRGKRPGRWSRAPLPTPTTRCCPRRWKSGACRSSRKCCRGISSSSSRSTSASSSRSRRSGRATCRRSACSRSSRKATCRWCAWRISRSSAAFR